MELIFLRKLRNYLLAGVSVSSATFAKGETQTVVCEVGPDAEECQVCISVPANQKWYFGYCACPDWVKYIRVINSRGAVWEISPSTACAFSGSGGIDVSLEFGLECNFDDEREWTYPITCDGNVVAYVRVVQEAMQKLSDGVYTRKIDGLEWTFTIRNGVASVGHEGCAATAIPDGTSGTVSIPKEFGGCPVKSIAEFAFCDCKKLDKIVIPAGVTNIGMCAFQGCSGLTSVNIPSSVVNIEAEAFSDCASLGTGVVIVDGCVLCVNGNCPERVELPFGTRLVGGSAFSGRNKLLAIDLPDGLTHIGNDAFDNCGFETVRLPESLESIGDMAFANSFLKEVRLPAGLGHIGNGAFTCTRIATIEIPSSVTFIGDGAFVPSNSKGGGIDVQVDPGNVNYVSKDGALFDKGLTTVFSWPEDKKIEIEHGIRRIAPSVFWGNTASVGDAVTIPASVTNIGRYAFSGCHLAKISFAEGLETISYNAFDYNDFTVVEFPSTLREIGGGIFNGCNHLVSVFYRGNAPKCLSPYNGTTSNLTSYVRVGTTGWGSSGDMLPDMWPRQEKYGGIVQRQIRAWTSYPTVGYVVSFDSNGGSGIMGRQVFQFDRNQSLSSNRFERAGWLFIGWALSPEGPVAYADGETVCNLPFENDLALTLYAVWEKLPDMKVATPVIAGPPKNEFSSPRCRVAISCETEGAEIYYSTNGKTPHIAEANRYKGPFLVSDTATIVAVAVKGEESSEYVEVMITKIIPESLTLTEVLDELKLAAVTTGGDAEWLPIEDETARVGGSCAVSGALDNDGAEESTWLEAKVYGRGTLTFWWRVSCEPDPRAGKFTYDFAAFEADDEVVVRKDGESDWVQVTKTFTTECEHVIRWSYNTDGWPSDDYDGCVWVDGVTWSGNAAPEESSKPTIKGDEGATVTGDAETGFVVKPSEGKTAVEVSIPDGIDAGRITVELSAKVESVKPHGAKVKIVSDGVDITGYLDIPGTVVCDDGGVVATQSDGVIDLTKATVKEEIVKEAMDVEKGAVIDLSGGSLGTTSPTITTAPTHVGLFYTFSEGRTLGGMERSASKPGDGKPWSPEIKIKGGNSAFYSIGVGKGE